MPQKIKKHLGDHEEYAVYETEEGEKGIAHKSENIKPGDMIEAKEILTDHPIQDAQNRVGLAIEELAWFFSKI